MEWNHERQNPVQSKRSGLRISIRNACILTEKHKKRISGKHGTSSERLTLMEGPFLRCLNVNADMTRMLKNLEWGGGGAVRGLRGGVGMVPDQRFLTIDTNSK